MTSLFVSADWSALVPAGSPEAAFGITPKDAKRRGVVPLEDGETLGEAETLMASANLIPTEADEPEAKEADEPADKAEDAPADKAMNKPANKGAGGKDT